MASQLVNKFIPDMEIDGISDFMSKQKAPTLGKDIADVFSNLQANLTLESLNKKLALDEAESANNKLWKLGNKDLIQELNALASTGTEGLNEANKRLVEAGATLANIDELGKQFTDSSKSASDRAFTDANTADTLAKTIAQETANRKAAVERGIIALSPEEKANLYSIIKINSDPKLFAQFKSKYDPEGLLTDKEFQDIITEGGIQQDTSSYGKSLVDAQAYIENTKQQAQTIYKGITLPETTVPAYIAEEERMTPEMLSEITGMTVEQSKNLMSNKYTSSWLSDVIAEMQMDKNIRINPQLKNYFPLIIHNALKFRGNDGFLRKIINGLDSDIQFTDNESKIDKERMLKLAMQINSSLNNSSKEIFGLYGKNGLISQAISESQKTLDNATKAYNIYSGATNTTPIADLIKKGLTDKIRASQFNITDDQNVLSKISTSIFQSLANGTPLNLDLHPITTTQDTKTLTEEEIAKREDAAKKAISESVVVSQDNLSALSDDVLNNYSEDKSLSPYTAKQISAEKQRRENEYTKNFNDLSTASNIDYANGTISEKGINDVINAARLLISKKVPEEDGLELTAYEREMLNGDAVWSNRTAQNYPSGKKEALKLRIEYYLSNINKNSKEYQKLYAIYQELLNAK